MVNLKKILFFLIRLTVSAGLLIYVCSLINFREALEILKKIDLIWFIPFFIGTSCYIFMATLRWKILLRGQGIHFTYGEVLRLTWLGAFLNNFMLGTVGGDLVKAVGVTQKTTLKTKAIISIIFDRFIGFVALSLLCLGPALLGYQKQELDWLRLIVLVGWVILLLIFLFFYYFARGSPAQRDETMNAGRGMNSASSVPQPAFSDGSMFSWLRNVIYQVKDALQKYQDKKFVCLQALALSLLLQTGFIFINIAYASVIGIKDVPLYYYFVFFPLVTIFTALPISLAGWGIGEAGYAYFLTLWGVPFTNAVMLSVVFRLSMVFWTLPGALFIVLKSRMEKPSEETAPR